MNAQCSLNPLLVKPKVAKLLGGVAEGEGSWCPGSDITTTKRGRKAGKGSPKVKVQGFLNVMIDKQKIAK